MKQTFLFFSAVLVALLLMAFGVIGGNNSDENRVAPSVAEHLVVRTPVAVTAAEKVIPDFIYTILPNEQANGGMSRYVAPVPEKQAQYEGGKEALVEYLKENTKEVRAVAEMDKLRPFKLSFRITKKGAIKNCMLDGTSGYPSIDTAMFQLITKTQKKWRPAENLKGQKTDQELVIVFALDGC
ncbi:hypothetical protein [Maribacter sp. 2-571]|uniref:hypothetical protein n=1 Tax=Maribacter sp. 2-571 TaxID=3417569 RepID=UPI003D3573A5